jgi:hypothetical protein
MRVFILGIVLVFISANLFAQDYIYTRDDKVIKSKILKMTKHNVFYTYYNEKKPKRKIRVRQIDSIKFEDGRVQVLKQYAQANAITIGAGMGMSTGGTGVKLQGPIFGTKYTAFHLGLGVIMFNGDAFESRKWGKMIDFGLKQYIIKGIFYFDIGLAYAGRDMNLFHFGGGVDIPLGRTKTPFGISVGAAAVIGTFGGSDIKRDYSMDVGIFLRFG